MLAKKHRLSTKDWPKANLNRIKTPNFLVLYKKKDCFTVGVVINKKVSKLAVQRNLLKRRIYQSIKETSLLYSSLTMIIVCFPQSLSLSQNQITQELIKYTKTLND